MNTRHTITVRHDVFQRLKQKGAFGESYSKLISRLIDGIDNFEGGNNSR
jgi:predicted CopG family antitoxin